MGKKTFNIKDCKINNKLYNRIKKYEISQFQPNLNHNSMNPYYT